MIRFMPDSFIDGLLRPVAMAMPDSWVYVEIIAPDFRFLFAVILCAACCLFMLRGTRLSRATLSTLVLMAAGFVVWSITTGNGRYAIPLLVVVGPLCLGLLVSLPGSRWFKLAITTGLIASQGFLIADNQPWRWWGLTPWRDAPYFHVDVPPAVTLQPATYVTLSSISYSLMATRFHPESRWINLSSQRGLGDASRAGKRTRQFLAESGHLQILFPSYWDTSSDVSTISQEYLNGLNRLLVRHGYTIENVKGCLFMPSRSLAQMGSRLVKQGAELPNAGFWLCPLARSPVTADSDEKVVTPDARTDAAFERIERHCPRFFPPGGAFTLPIPNGKMRSYLSSDMKIYLFNDGRLAYKYLRALNTTPIGTVDDVLGGNFDLDCSKLRGRSGLPWQRAI